MKVNFENNILNIDNIPNYEKSTQIKLDNNYLKVIILNSLFSFVLLTCGLMICYYFFGVLKSSNNMFGICLIYIFFWITYGIYVRLSFCKKSYSFRDHDVIYKFGLFNETSVLIPFNRIQHIALHQGFFSRKFGLASLQFYTAGGSTTDISIPGMKVEVAKSYKEIISDKIEKIN